MRLKIEELKAGMILADPVYNQQDLLLLEKGTALTKKRIWMLKTWGIDRVGVKGEEQTDAPPVYAADTETRESIESELKAKFADVIDDPIMQAIMKAACRQLQKSLTDDPEGQNEST